MDREVQQAMENADQQLQVEEARSLSAGEVLAVEQSTPRPMLGPIRTPPADAVLRPLLPALAEDSLLQPEPSSPL